MDTKGRKKFCSSVCSDINKNPRKIVQPCDIIKVLNDKSTDNNVRKQRRRSLKRIAVMYKGGKCNECGYSKSLKALDFHHIEPSHKDFVISSRKDSTFDAIKSELDKCILLCSNCHREEHERIEKNK